MVPSAQRWCYWKWRLSLNSRTRSRNTKCDRRGQFSEGINDRFNFTRACISGDKHSVRLQKVSPAMKETC